MAEWVKSSISELIKAYKHEANLYNSKHKLYYNKQARNLSLKRINEAVNRNRPGTTLAEITKKIQTLRTQFGQEVAKIEKSQSLGEDLIYKPKIWWFVHLEWIGDFMKTRTDSTPLSVKAKSFAKKEEITDELFDIMPEDGDDMVVDEFSTEIEFSDYDTRTQEADPPAKRQKTYPTPKFVRNQTQAIQKRDNPDVQTIEYTLINEDTTEIVQPQNNRIDQPPQVLEIHHESRMDDASCEKYKRRSKAFGKFVAALVMDITDDKIFFELQRNITSTIQDASVKQYENRRS